MLNMEKNVPTSVFCFCSARKLSRIYNSTHNIGINHSVNSLLNVYFMYNSLILLIFLFLLKMRAKEIGKAEYILLV